MSTETRVQWTIERDDSGTFLCSNKAPWIIEGPIPDDTMTTKLLDYLNALEDAAALLAESDWTFNEYGEYSEDVAAVLERLRDLRG